jgi:hypothetical protein
MVAAGGAGYFELQLTDVSILQPDDYARKKTQFIHRTPQPFKL